ncbi:apolipoprotein L1 isoform X2 [Triplophysa rosa]|uniref:apolipoprotein L1 isoform X2 n=1 Tax=Triplophysa rosa TaxID=992332 RepID=UPI002545C1C2|nr:apolipoprotein L1 isoform X2 [Triplophysa rosa]
MTLVCFQQDLLIMELHQISDPLTHYTAEQVMEKTQLSCNEEPADKPSQFTQIKGPDSNTETVDRQTHEQELNSISHNMTTEMDRNQGDTDHVLEKKQDTEREIPREENNPKWKGEKKNNRNPFLPELAARSKTVQKRNGKQDGGYDSDPADTKGRKKPLMEWLDDFRLHESQREDEEDLDGLMDWWSTVEQWEEMPKGVNMTEKEEAKAFALTAEKVQKGIHVFNKLFSERAEGLWQHVIDLHAIADGLDRFNKKTKIAQITGGSTSALGGIATITGLALAPFTMGTSLIVTAVGLGVAMAGGLTSASAGISNTVNNSLDRKKVERIVEDYQEKMADLNKCMKFIKQGITNLRKFNLNRVKKHAYNQDFPGFDDIYEDGAMAGKAILSNANEIMRVMQVANAAGTTAARAVQIASISTGVLTGLFVGMDIYFVAKDSHELKNGAKSEFAAKIREVAEQLHEGLVELNSIREELQLSNAVNEKQATS